MIWLMSLSNVYGDADGQCMFHGGQSQQFLSMVWNIMYLISTPFSLATF